MLLAKDRQKTNGSTYSICFVVLQATSQTTFLVE